MGASRLAGVHDGVVESEVAELAFDSEEPAAIDEGFAVWIAADREIAAALYYYYYYYYYYSY